MELQKGDLYITIQESDLVNLVKQVRDKKYELGKDISTDFQKMGTLAAQMIIEKKGVAIKNDFNFIDRFSA